MAIDKYSEEANQKRIEADLRQDAKRRMKAWREENETSIWDVVMIVAVCSLLAYLIIRSMF